MDGDYLSALALLKTNYDQRGATYLDYITPFIADSIRTENTPAIDESAVAGLTLERFGITIPEGVTRTILRRLAQRGFGSRSNRQFMPDQPRLDEEFNLDSTRTQAQDQILSLISQFKGFAHEEVSLQLSDEQATSALTQYAFHHGTEILRRALRRQSLTPELEPDQLTYVTSRFVIHAFEQESAARDTLLMLAQSSKLISALYLTSPNEIDRRITDLTAILDTRTTLSALGYHSDDSQLAALELLDLAYGAGVRLVLFEDTLSEIESILEASRSGVRRRGRTGSAVDSVDARFFQLGYSASDIVLLIDRLRDDLANLRVQVMERPPITREVAVDEAEFERVLEERVRYPSKQPLVHDLNVLTATFRLRRGRQSRRLEDCRAQFITPNASLVSAARRFFYDDEGQTWPIAISEDEFVTLLWLKKPLAIPNFPMQRIICDAYAAMEPSRVNWERYLEELDRLLEDESISEDTYFYFRYSSAAKDALMAETRGQPLAVADLDAIFRRVQAQLAEPYQDVAQSAVDAAQILRTESEGMQERLARLEQQLAEASEEKLHITRQRKETRDRAREHAVKKARQTCKALLIAFSAAVLVGIGSSVYLLPNLSSDSPWWLRAVVWCCTAGAVIPLIFRELTGRPMVDTIRGQEVKIAKRLEARWLRRLGIIDTGES